MPIDERAFQKLMEKFQTDLVKICHGQEDVASGLAFGDAVQWSVDVGKKPVQLKAQIDAILKEQ